MFHYQVQSGIPKELCQNQSIFQQEGCRYIFCSFTGHDNKTTVYVRLCKAYHMYLGHRRVNQNKAAMK